LDELPSRLKVGALLDLGQLYSSSSCQSKQGFPTGMESKRQEAKSAPFRQTVQQAGLVTACTLNKQFLLYKNLSWKKLSWLPENCMNL
jgi:hypothetical protein